MLMTRRFASAIRGRLHAASTRSSLATTGADISPLDWRSTPGIPTPEGVTVVDLTDSPNHFPGRFVLQPAIAAEIAALVAESHGIPARHLRPVTGVSIIPWPNGSWPNGSWPSGSWLKVRRGLVWDDELAYDGRQICELLEQSAPEHLREATYHCLWGRCFRAYE